MQPEDLMRALKAAYPDVKAGTVVDPYTSAFQAGLNPDSRAYTRTLDHLLTIDVLLRSPEHEQLTARSSNMNAPYVVTPKGEQEISQA